MSTTRKVTLRKDGGADLGSAERINFITGNNIILAIALDAANKEFDVTITAEAGLPPAWLDQFFPAVDPDTYKGAYATVTMTDGVDIPIYQTFMIPKDIATITRAVVIIIPNASGDLYWSCVTNFGRVCDDEDYQTHGDAIALNAIAVTVDEIECIDISDALTVAVGGDLVGLHFVRAAENVLDTIGDTVHYIGVLIEGDS